MDNKKKIEIMFIALIAIVMIFFAIFVFKGKRLQPNTFIYDNGEQQFEVTRVGDKGIGTDYDIKIFLGNKEIPYLITVMNDPNELQEIPVDKDIREMIWKSEGIFITINPNVNLTGRTTVAAMEIEKFFDNPYFLNKPTGTAFTESYQKRPEYTIKTCEDANPKLAIVWLKLGEETKVFKQNNCIVAQGTDEKELIRAAERLALYTIGVMN